MERLLWRYPKRRAIVGSATLDFVACAVGSLNGAGYQYQQHAVAFLDAGGSTEQLHALKFPDSASCDVELFDRTERSVLQLSLEMTRSIKVCDETFASAFQSLGSLQAIVELVGVIAALQPRVTLPRRSGNRPIPIN